MTNSKNNLEYLIDSLHPFEVELLAVLKKTNKNKITSFELARISSLDLNGSNRALNWLKEKDLMSVESNIIKSYIPSKEGNQAIDNGLPEKKLLVYLLPKRKIPIKNASRDSGLSKQEFNIAFGVLKKFKAISIEKGNIQVLINEDEAISIFDKDQKFLILNQLRKNVLKLTDKNKNILSDLLKRGLVEEQITKEIIGTLSKSGILLRDSVSNMITLEDKLTPEILQSGAWKTLKLRPFDVEISAPAITTGKRHFYWQAIDYVRQIWLNLGFKEMEGTIVQSSFWNFDALFVPQDHPARDEQDTFYIKQPSKGRIDDLEFNNVSQTHINGGNTGSTGWKGSFDRDVSETLVLRTHTTCLSAQTLKLIKKEGYPAKYFAIGRNFRNEKVDWKHLAEFDQVEGIVVDPDVTFPDLLGYLQIFFKAMGFPQARFRPSYYPYTEPSVGIDVFHPIKKTWVELGGAGVFRPECVEPILGEDIPVLAWGPGIGRMVMDQYNIVDIREQYYNDIAQLKKSPLWMR